MKRPSLSLGKLAVAACAVAASLVLSPGEVAAQKIIVPPAPDEAKVVVPGAKATVELNRTGRVTIERNGFIQQAPAAKLIVPMAGAVAVDPELLIRQAMEQLRPTLEKELRLLTSVAEPTPSQRREIAIDAVRDAREYVDRFLKRNPTQQASVLQIILNDPAKLIRQSLLHSTAKKLDDTQSARYRAELDRKEATRKEVGVLNIASSLERQLHLSPAQREKLCESLRKSWDDRDYPLLENSSVYDLYTAMLSDPVIVPLLDESQEKVWRSLRKYHLASLRTPSPANAILSIDLEDRIRDEDVMAAFGEEAKK